MIMHIPPECKGQIVEVSYGSDGEYTYRRTLDKSDRTECWHRVSWDDVWDNTPDDEEPDFEPWNREPGIMESLWEKCDAPSA